MEKARTYKKAIARPYRKSGKRKSGNIFGKKDKPKLIESLPDFDQHFKQGLPLACIGAELYYSTLFEENEIKLKTIRIDPVEIKDMDRAGELKKGFMQVFRNLYTLHIDNEGYRVVLLYNREPLFTKQEEEKVTFKNH